MPCPWWLWIRLGTQLSWHYWELLIHRICPGTLQLQAGMFELGSQVGRSWLWHPLACCGAGGRRSKGAAPSVPLSFPWVVPDLALPLCCDCRPQARRDRSRPPGRKGRIPHRDRYTGPCSPRVGSGTGMAGELAPCPLAGPGRVLGPARLSAACRESPYGSSTSHRGGGRMLAGVPGPQVPCGVGEMRLEWSQDLGGSVPVSLRRGRSTGSSGEGSSKTW